MDTKESEKKDMDGSPPPWGSWAKVYWFVALFFVAEVVLFYLFTRAFS